MKPDRSYSWKDVVVVIVLLTGFVLSAQAFALGSDPQDQRELDATSYVEPNVTVFEMSLLPQGTNLPGENSLAVSDGNGGSAQDQQGFGLTEAEPPLTFDVVTSREVTLSATVRDPSETTGSVDFTFEVEEVPDVLKLLAGDDLIVLPAMFPKQMGTIDKEDSSIPEPSTMVLVGLGLIMLLGIRRRP
jgi:hypothetical protein